MTVAKESPYGTAHRDYVAGTETQQRQGGALADRAWDVAAFVEEVREHDGDIPCYFPLKAEESVQRDGLKDYLYELGYDAELIEWKNAPGWLIRIGPPRKRRRFFRQRPKAVERAERHG